MTPTASVLILGQGALARGLAASFAKLGAEVDVLTITCEEDLNAEGGVRGVVEQRRPDYVVPLIGGLNTELLAQIEEDDLTVIAPGTKAFSATADRVTMRRTANEQLGLPTSEYLIATSGQELRAAVEELGLPCVVKPVSPLTHGPGHMLLRTEEHVDAAVEAGYAEVLVERFVDFDVEISLQAVRSIDPATGELATWFGEPIGYNHENGELVEAWQPQPIAAAALDNARSLAARITGELGGQGLYSVDMFVKGEDVYFSTVDPGPTEAGMVTIGAQRFSQFDLHARAVMGLPIDMTLVTPASISPLGDAEMTRAWLGEILAIPETTVRLADASLGDGMILASGEDTSQARDRVSIALSKRKKN